MVDYDRLYDMAHPRLRDVLRRVLPNILGHRGMREPRLELGCPKAPDPKSRLAPSSEPSSPRGEDQGATERHENIPSADESTTDCTTYFQVAVL